ncbi:phosphatase PAP2 family protein [Aestuariibacter sp. GS-14]|uniref:phosphatase PAP2 family protein n=1 Tax=Aestuariibacter sp. GS-14 TaxID=2590670 RepID=UPI0011262929|nr:phosphatase PAP2 family protein [Aestuariibacter sp. GS-14]TPV58553.1 phosphatase PAP2 family protein [Aestuariibacter sp. GS-14]
MNELNKHLRQCYLMQGLPVHLVRSRDNLINREDQQVFRYLTWLACSLLVVATFITILGGYHGGFHTLNQNTPLLPDAFWSMLTYFGDTAVALTLVLFCARRCPAMLNILLLAAIYGTLISHGMKNYFDATRPAGVLLQTDFALVGQAFQRNSFPSGHSMAIFIFVTLQFYFVRKRSTRITLMLFGSAVAVSRVMVGAHWPVDVLTGAGLGILVTLAAIYTAKRWRFGFSRITHIFTLSLLIISAGLLYYHNGGYPLASGMGSALSVSALAFCLIDYLFLPVAVQHTASRHGIA